MPTSVGNNLNTISIPSFAPSKNVSYTLFFSATPYNNIINTGTVTCDITETNTYNLDSETVIKHIGSRKMEV